jgi:hypothetical protein
MHEIASALRVRGRARVKALLEMIAERAMALHLPVVRPERIHQRSKEGMVVWLCEQLPSVAMMTFEKAIECLWARGLIVGNPLGRGERSPGGQEGSVGAMGSTGQSMVIEAEADGHGEGLGPGLMLVKVRIQGRRGWRV